MKFRPLHDRVVIRRVEEEEKSKGGIIIPDTAKEKPMEGEVDRGRSRCARRGRQDPARSTSRLAIGCCSANGRAPRSSSTVKN